jgi:hypothetical protein
LQEAPHADFVILTVAKLFGLVVERVKFTSFETVPDPFKERLDGVTVSHLLEIHFGYADLSR